MNEKAPAMRAVLLEVQGLSRHALRLTECGSQPLQNGDQVLVQIDVAKSLLDRNPANLKAVGEPKEVASLKCAHWEPVKVQPAATETEKAAPSSAEGKPGNKNMAGKPVAKA